MMTVSGVGLRKPMSPFFCSKLLFFSLFERALGPRMYHVSSLLACWRLVLASTDYLSGLLLVANNLVFLPTCEIIIIGEVHDLYICAILVVSSVYIC